MKIDYTHELNIEDYHALRKSAGWYEIDTVQAQNGINNSAYVVAAVHENKTVGMARLVSDGGYIMLIVDVIVHPDYQRNGIGKEMMEMIMEHINSTIKDGQSAFVNLIAAKGKEPFYEKFGFVKRPDENSGSGMTQWILK